MPKITLLFASLHALLMLGLVLPIARHRHARRIGLGDGGDTLLARRIRVHGNFIEHVPFALLVLALLELCGLAPMWLWGFGSALLPVKPPKPTWPRPWLTRWPEHHVDRR